ncbi:hypothetical protein RHGRI_003461 [Rhododendron griersonianum]|uniref:Protein RDM1 n=1 Tax=Rhododendron griersonianum TaxID=479676 RepID=A0AAV6L690_9ERIC|nr:hypothetical protein RHGRI_003461 [Rhododendron griersonianum]
MEGPIPGKEEVDVILSDDSSPSPSHDAHGVGGSSGSANKNSNENITIDLPPKETESDSEDAVFRRAQMYQDYMKQIPIPTHRGSVIPFTSWTGLGYSIKKLYGQPLHYLTNILLKQWDRMRIGSEDEERPLDTVIHPCKAEASIWLIEEVHRLTTSHHHLSKLWLSDPMPHAFIDPVFPII